jgi:hypothetical protein
MPVVPDTVAVVAGERLATVKLPAHYWAHARAFLSASIDDVWAAVQWRPGVLVAIFPDVPTVECQPSPAPEPGYTLSYGVKETPRGGALYQANWFLVYWRGEPTRDATGALQKVNLKVQKVDGTGFIQVMQESVVATPATGGGTWLEIVRQINAPGESATTAADWIRLWVQALQAELAGTREALVPTSYCFP